VSWAAGSSGVGSESRGVDGRLVTWALAKRRLTAMSPASSRWRRTRWSEPSGVKELSAR
jgi:hypothetical protein